MLKQTQFISNDKIRGILVSQGLFLQRIRTISRYPANSPRKLVEIELDKNQSEDARNWSPLLLCSWILSSFTIEVEMVDVEFRRGIWFLRLTCLSNEEVNRRTGQTTLDDALLGNQSTLALGDETFDEMLDNLANG